MDSAALHTFVFVCDSYGVDQSLVQGHGYSFRSLRFGRTVAAGAGI